MIYPVDFCAPGRQGAQCASLHAADSIAGLLTRTWFLDGLSEQLFEHRI